MNTETEVFELNKKSVNLILVILTAVSFFVFLLWEKQTTQGAFYGNTTDFFLEHGALYGPLVKEGEIYRLVTYMFLHGDMEHLVNNMLILFFLGNAMERYLGKVKYLILYFSSGILAAIGSIVYNTSYPVCVGASGAVFGVSGALAYLVLRNKGNLDGLTRKQMLLFLVLSVYGGLVNQGVDNAAHVAGMVAGFLMAIILYRKKAEQ